MKVLFTILVTSVDISCKEFQNRKLKIHQIFQGVNFYKFKNTQFTNYFAILKNINHEKNYLLLFTDPCFNKY